MSKNVTLKELQVALKNYEEASHRELWEEEYWHEKVFEILDKYGLEFIGWDEDEPFGVWLWYGETKLCVSPREIRKIKEDE
jgi:hypothetical protein